MTEVKSPYNFVPAPTESEVYKPEWANQVSHDIPFSDGESGEITLKITAETPIFIRNGHSKKDSEIFEKHKKGELPNPSSVELEAIHRYLPFSNINGQYFIPATSIKGMLRNILEIISFSKMSRINDHLHSIRQIMKTQGTVIEEGYELTNQKDNILAGYLIEKDGKFFIYPSGKPQKIRYTDLDKKFGGLFENNFKNSVSTNFEERTGAFKYENIIKDKALEYKFEKHTLNEDKKQKAWVSGFQPLSYVKFAENDEGKWGRIVCVGQATAYKDKEARKGEYVFWGKKEDILSDDTVRISVSDKILEIFLFLNRHNKGKSEELKDWTYWKIKTKAGIPIFYRQDKKEQLVDFGLTFMYKHKVTFSTKDILPYGKDLDLADCILGTIQKENQSKGRLFCSHFKAKNKIEPLAIQDNVLSSPKSSFTPFYLNQKGVNGYTSTLNTYIVGTQTLRGFKRYPVQSTDKKQGIDPDKIKLISSSQPLPQGTTFEGKIRFHNLRKIEIGALLSAITLHNSQETFHSLGGLKPFGYGRISIEITNFNGFKFDKTEYLNAFEAILRVHSPKWGTVMNQLLTMASLQPNESKLSYMPLEDFQEVKNQGLYLQDYYTLASNKIKTSFISTEDDLQKVKNLHDAWFEKIKQLKTAIDVAISNNKFEEADNLLNQAIIIPKCDIDYYNKLEEIAQKRSSHDKEVAVLQQFETALQSDNINVVEHFLKTIPSFHRNGELYEKLRKLKANQGLSKDFYDTTISFNAFKSKIDKWLKNVDDPTPFLTELNSIVENFIRLELSKAKTKRDWNGSLEKNGNWKKVTEWLEKEKAQELYKQLIG